MAGWMVGISLAIARATLIVRGANIFEPDGPLLLAEERGLPLKFNEEGIHPSSQELWG